MKSKLLILVCLFLCGQAWADQDTLRPASDAYSVLWTDEPAAGSDYDKIDEITADGDTTYLYDLSTNPQGWLHSTWSSSNDVDSVEYILRMRSPAVVGTPKVRLKRMLHDGSWDLCANATSDTVTESINSSYTDYSIMWTTNPCDGSAWTVSDVNDANGAWAFDNVAIGTAADTLGSVSTDYKNKLVADYISLYKYTATFGGALDSLGIYCAGVNAESNWKLGIYSDSINGATHRPKDLMDTCAAFQMVNGWNIRELVNIGNAVVYEDSSYWIAFREETAGDTLYKEGTVSGGGYYKALDFDDAWEATFTAGTAENTRYALIAIDGFNVENRVTQSFVVVYSHAGAPSEVSPRRRK